MVNFLPGYKISNFTDFNFSFTQKTHYPLKIHRLQIIVKIFQKHQYRTKQWNKNSQAYIAEPCKTGARNNAKLLAIHLLLLNKKKARRRMKV